MFANNNKIPKSAYLVHKYDMIVIHIVEVCYEEIYRFFIIEVVTSAIME